MFIPVVRCNCALHVKKKEARRRHRPNVHVSCIVSLRLPFITQGAVYTDRN
jgi:hypothetical protein